jgi:hypothetical protein
MMPPKKGVLAQAQEENEPTLPGDPATPDDSMEHEGAEAPDFEAEEGAAEGGEDAEGGEGGGEGEKTYSKEDRELFDLVVGRTMKALSQNADDLDTALKADPIRATVEFGTSALRTVAMGAGDAGSPISFDILAQAGMQVIKELAGIANEKGYLADEEIETFLKECFQQSLSKYTKMDAADGTLKQEDLDKVKGFAKPGEEAKAVGSAVGQVQDRGALAAAQQEPM